MESLDCSKCGLSVLETDNFCSKCGNNLKCKSCKTFLAKDTAFCANCGEPVNAIKSIEQSALNTIKYKKSSTEVSCEISFTDNVGKERMNDLLSAIITNRSGTSDNRSDDKEISDLNIAKGNNIYELNNHIELKPNDNPEQEVGDLSEVTHLNDLTNKLECSENTWLGIHALYVSDQGAKNFSKDSVRATYMAKRKTDSRVKNFAMEWKKAHQKYFKTIKDDEFNFQNGAIGDLRNVILGINKKPNSKIKKSTNSITAKRTPGKSIAIEEFDLSKGVNPNKLSLEEFLAIKKPGDNTSDKIVVIAYYITRVNKTDTFNEGQIEFAYKALQLSDRPGHLRQTINNIKNSKVWFKDVSQGRWSLERIGEIYVDEKLPPKEMDS